MEETGFQAAWGPTTNNWNGWQADAEASAHSPGRLHRLYLLSTAAVSRCDRGHDAAGDAMLGRGQLSTA